MKLSQAKNFLPILQAAAEGKTIQTKLDDDWVDLDPMHEVYFKHSQDERGYRIKPPATLRPWKPSEVPVGALIRIKGDNKPSVIISTGESGVFVPCNNRTMNSWVDSFATCLSCYEYSKDFGKSWWPCGILE